MTLEEQKENYLADCRPGDPEEVVDRFAAGFDVWGALTWIGLMGGVLDLRALGMMAASAVATRIKPSWRGLSIRFRGKEYRTFGDSIEWHNRKYDILDGNAVLVDRLIEQKNWGCRSMWHEFTIVTSSPATYGVGLYMERNDQEVGPKTVLRKMVFSDETTEIPFVIKRSPADKLSRIRVWQDSLNPSDKGKQKSNNIRMPYWEELF